MFLIFRLFREIKLSSLPPERPAFRFHLRLYAVLTRSKFATAQNSGAGKGKNSFGAVDRFCVFDTFLSRNYINGTKIQNGMRVIGRLKIIKPEKNQNPPGIHAGPLTIFSWHRENGFP